MKLICSPSTKTLPALSGRELPVLLYARADPKKSGSAGAAIAEEVKRKQFEPAARACDLLSLALSVVTADYALLRKKSPDGWTREIELIVAVNEPDFWASQTELIERLLRFLTTDRWSITFASDGYRFRTPKKIETPDEECVALLSGGVDSLVGTINLVESGMKPFAVSQTVQGDRQKQSLFASELGGGLRHLQMNHNAKCPGENERSQRGRSMIFFAYGIFAATSLRLYRDGAAIPLYVSENGLISINPPLTDARIGSLSTRTTHPVFMAVFQQLLKQADLRVEFRNPHQFKTKGEMLSECADQAYLRSRAYVATSCCRFSRNGFRHCGRCVPCLIRRAAFHHWKKPDTTDYVYGDLSRDDNDHSRFDDVRSAAMALATIETDGLDCLLGSSLSSDLIDDPKPYRVVVERGFNELGRYLSAVGVK